ncbi:hypothetical protein F4810DRAFT_481674 [Camillea tinctor]|nr:hypothetical protein F4810DRAFT_481674 [Camillea tinctor]
MSDTTSLVWLITGASTGFGLELAKIAASRGHRVIAATRSPEKMAPVAGITPVRLDQNEPLPKIQAAMENIISIHGTVDIVVNNAAYVQTGTVEEVSPEDTIKQFQANTFGPINVYRAILPHMRQKRSGTLITIGSMAAWYSMQGCNMYNASKAALRRLTTGLADEIRHLGIKHCLVEPGYFRTELLNPAANIAKTDRANRIPDYDEVNATADGIFEAFHGHQLGDTAKGVEIIYDVITSSGVAAGVELPGFLPLGSDAITEITKNAQMTIDDVQKWASIAKLSDFQD